MPDAAASRDELRAELARLRTLAHLSGQRVAAALHVGQATVSRIENGITLPSLANVAAWLEVVQADEDDARRLTQLAERVHGSARGWAQLLGRDGHAQREAGERERTALSVRNFQPTVIPGLLQTPEYARAILSIGRAKDVEAAVAQRVERQQVLYEDGRLFTFLIAEHVLTWPLGGDLVVAAQRDRLVSLARLPSVDLAVVPAAATLAAAWSNFILWEPPDGPVYAAVELPHGAVEMFRPDEVESYERLWGRLWSAALHGQEAVEMLRSG